MKWIFILLLALVAALAPAGESDIQRGRLKRIDLERVAVTLAAGGTDHTYSVTAETRIFGAENLPLMERLKTLHTGEEVFFKVVQRDGKDVLVGVKAVNGPSAPSQAPLRPYDTSNMKPLPELGAGEYHGYRGGLYPDGKSTRPAAHERAGIALARAIRPLDAAGNPSPDGRIVLLSVGMSNTSQASDGFARQLASYAEKNSRLIFVNGAQGGMTARMTQSADDNGPGQRYWTTVDERLRAAGLTAAQVQVAWIKQADAGPTEAFPRHAKALQAELANVVRTLKTRCPNVKLAYLSSRTFGGYARTPLNPEPFAYEGGFSVKWLVEDQIKGDPALNFDAARGPVKAPWLSWGPYLWANGTKALPGGLAYEQVDFAQDGTHESPSGQAKVGRALLKFFQSDATTRPWFASQPSARR